MNVNKLVLLFILLISYNHAKSQKSDTVLQSGTLKKLAQKKSNLDNKGYIFSSIDIVSYDPIDSLYTARIHKGSKVEVYKLVLKYNDNCGNTATTQYYKSKNQLYNALSNQVLDDIKEGKMDALYTLQNFDLLKDTLVVVWDVGCSKQLKFNDTILLSSSDKSIQLEYIQGLLADMKNDISLKDRIQYATTMVNQLEYYQVDPDAKIIPYDSTYSVVLNIKPRNIDKIYGILGLLSNGYETQKLQLTGDVLLSFHNLFKNGIGLSLNWQKKLVQSQFLYTYISVPFIFKSPFGIYVGFDLEKFDTSYLRLNLGINGTFQLNPFQKLSIQYYRQQGIINQFNKQEIYQGKLPEYLDFVTNKWGFGYSYKRIDDPIFKHKSIELSTDVLFGIKNIEKNNSIDSLKDGQGNSLSYLYDSINLKQTTWSFRLIVESHLPLGKSWVYRTHLETQGVFADKILSNEKFFFGGVNSLRGYDDKALTSSIYVFLNQDFQYYLARNFYSNIFVDIGTFQNSLDSMMVLPVSFGVGLTFLAKSSLVQLNTGVGRRDYENFRLGDVKFHISYTNVF